MKLAWVLCIGLLCMGSTSSVSAQEMPRFSAAQFGKANLTLPQHLTGPLENLLDPRHDNFEQIGRFREDNRYRRLSNAVGRLDLLLADRSGKPQYTSICTSSLIAEDLLLTSYHCLPGVEPGLTVVQAQLRMGYVSAEIEGQPYEVALPPVESHRALDYAIVRVKGTPGRTYGAVRLDLRDAKAAEALVIIHHPQGYPKRLTRRDCFAAPSRPLMGTDLAHHCDTLPGSSGAPVFSDEDFALVGLHYGGYGGVPSSDTYNFAKRIASIQQASAQFQRLAAVTPAVVPAPAPTPQPAPPTTTSAVAPSPSTATPPASTSTPAVVTPPPPQQPSPSGGTKVAVGVYPQAPETPQTLRNSINMELVLIQAGTFQMGSNDYDNQKPVHTVRLSRAFYLGKYEVTQGQWQAVMGNNHSKFTGDPQRPVERVSWDDVQEFIRRLQAKEGGAWYRLPTEAEWEYATRAGSTTAYSFGDNASQLGQYAWYGDNAGDTTHPVGQKQPNAWGLYDMHGNVWEWVQDWYGAYASGTVTDPAGPQSGSYRVTRGGGWNHGARVCRSADRSGGAPGHRGFVDLGFRLLREAP